MIERDHLEQIMEIPEGWFINHNDVGFNLEADKYLRRVSIVNQPMGSPILADKQLGYVCFNTEYVQDPTIVGKAFKEYLNNELEKEENG